MGRARNTSHAVAADRRADAFSNVMGDGRGNPDAPSSTAERILAQMAHVTVPPLADERLDLIPANTNVVSVHLDNEQDPEEEDPDYGLFTYAKLASGHVIVEEHKNERHITADRIAERLDRLGLLQRT